MSDDEAAVDVLQETAVSDPTQEPVVSATVDVVDGEAAETAEEPAPRVSTPPPPRVSAWARPIIKAADVSFFLLFSSFFSLSPEITPLQPIYAMLRLLKVAQQGVARRELHQSARSKKTASRVSVELRFYSVHVSL